MRDIAGAIVIFLDFPIASSPAGSTADLMGWLEMFFGVGVPASNALEPSACGRRPSSNPDDCAAACRGRSQAIPPIIVSTFKENAMASRFPFIGDAQFDQLLANGRAGREHQARDEDFAPRPVVKLFTPDAGATLALDRD